MERSITVPITILNKDFIVEVEYDQRCNWALTTLLPDPRKEAILAMEYGVISRPSEPLDLSDWLKQLILQAYWDKIEVSVQEEVYCNHP